MIKAIVINGVVVPREPLPADWQEGIEVEVERAVSNGDGENGIRSTKVTTKSQDNLDGWMAKVQESANDMDPEDEVILEKTVRELREQSRDLARKEAGAS